MIRGQTPFKTLGAAPTPDGRYIWYAGRTGDWAYNAIFPQYQLYRYDRETGASTLMTNRYGSAFRPAVSPDGKPEALLYRVIMASSNVGDVILDPFFGSGTTGAVAKKLGRRWIGIERDKKYVKVAQKRIDAVAASASEAINVEKPKQARVPFGTLLECGYLQPGQSLFFVEKGVRARILSNGHLKCGDLTGSIHGVARALKDGAPVHGWDMWFYKDENGKKIVIDELRKTF